MQWRHRNAAAVLIAALALSAGLWHPAATAQPPEAINIHGQLLNDQGMPLTGTRAYEVTFYDAELDGNAIGATITGTATFSEAGLFNIAVTPPAAILSASEVWYALGLDTDEPADDDASDDLFPNRVQVLSVPFALMANEVVQVGADRVGAGNVDDTELSALDGVSGNIQTQLDAKADSSEVYSTGEVDSQFVDAAGDTMSGALGVDQIGEATPDAGVTVDGVLLKDGGVSADVLGESTPDAGVMADGVLLKDGALSATGVTTDAIGEFSADSGVSVEGVTLKDNFVELPQIAAPATTADRLYNVGGDVFFNGTQLGASGGSGGTTTLFPAVMSFQNTGEALADSLNNQAANAGVFIGATSIAAGDRFTGIVPRHVAYRVERMYILYHERDTWDDADATVTATFAVKNAAGVDQHMLLTTPDLQDGFTELQWVDMTASLPVAEEDRTVEPFEFIGIHVTSTNNTASTGGSVLWVLLEVTDIPPA